VSVLRVAPASRPLAGELWVPGDKSIGHRAVLLAALGDGPATVRGLSGGADNERTVAALGALGVAIERIGPGELAVAGAGLDGLAAPKAVLDCGNSGTTMRLFAGLLAGQPFVSSLDGDDYLRARPMARVARPLEQMGAQVTGRAGAKPGEVYPPLRIAGKRPLAGVDYASPVASAQVKSAVLLAGLYAEGTVRVREPGPSRDHTERMLAALGVPIESTPGQVVLDPRPLGRRLPARDWDVPGDLSSAAFLLCAGVLIEGSEVTLRAVGVNPTRTGVLDVLRAMGAHLEIVARDELSGEPVADLRVRGSDLDATAIAGTLTVRALDEIPILAVLAARARGTTVIRDAAELRVKESDRIATMARALTTLGVTVREREDGLEIDGPARIRGGVACDSGGDHRIAMACAVAGLCADSPIEIRDTDNVATSFPGFADALCALGADVALSP
jgi:3-phosphoshikimate 1-carboxyvinyltransferase